MKKIYFSLVAILLISLMNAQEQCTYRAMLLDSLDLPINKASITAFNSKNESAGYTFSDSYGEFKLEMPCNENYELEIEHINFKSKVQKVSLTKNMREKIKLTSDAIGLDEVIAQGRIPIQVKGDTIEYDAQSFTTGQEENLEDILKKLPGLEVEDGKVFYQGKEIRSIKVEGREIFGGNQKLVSKNLPAEAVDKVQLNKKFKANPFASSLQDDEQPELNIVLKEDKKNLIFGNLTLGGDAQEHYDAQEKLFYFSPKTDATLISDFNSYGNEVFSRSDYYEFLGGFSDFMEEGGESALREVMGDITYASGGNAARMQNHLGALHLGIAPNDRTNITAFAMATDNEAEYNSSSLRHYPEFDQRDINHNLNKIFSFVSRLKVDYTTKKAANIKYSINFNHQDSENITEATSYLNDNENPRDFRNSNSERENYAVNQKLSYIKKLGDNNIGFYISHIYQKENPDLTLSSKEAPFKRWLSLSPQNNRFELNQERELTANNLFFLTVYNHLLTNLSNLKIKAGVNYSTQFLDNTIFDYTTPISNANTPTIADYTYQEYYAEATYTRKFGNLRVDAGLGTHYFNSNNQVETMQDRDINKVVFLPHFSANYELNNNSRIYSIYRKDFTVPNVVDLSPAYQIRSYYNLFTGNPELNIGKSNLIILGYYYYNYFNFVNFGISARYSWSDESIKNGGFYNQTAQFTSLYNVPKVENNLSLSTNFSKRFSKFYNIRLSANVGQSNYYSYNNGKFIDAQSFNHGYSIRNTLKAFKKIEVNFGANANFSEFENEIRANKFISLSPFIEGAFAPNEKWLLEFDYNFPNSWNDGEKINTNHNLEGSLRFKPMKNTFVKLIAGNIFGNDLLVNSGSNDFYSYVNETEMLGRYFIAQVRYKF